MIKTTLPTRVYPQLPPMIESTTGGWSNFISGASKTANWCGRQVVTAGTAIWSGVQKVSAWAVTFFTKVSFYCAIGTTTAVNFVKTHARQFLVGGICAAVGLAIGFLFARLCGCCNKPTQVNDDVTGHLPQNRVQQQVQEIEARQALLGADAPIAIA